MVTPSVVPSQARTQQADAARVLQARLVWNQFGPPLDAFSAVPFVARKHRARIGRIQILAHQQIVRLEVSPRLRAVNHTQPRSQTAHQRIGQTDNCTRIKANDRNRRVAFAGSIGCAKETCLVRASILRPTSRNHSNQAPCQAAQGRSNTQHSAVRKFNM